MIFYPADGDIRTLGAKGCECRCWTITQVAHVPCAHVLRSPIAPLDAELTHTHCRQALGAHVAGSRFAGSTAVLTRLFCAEAQFRGAAQRRRPFFYWRGLLLASVCVHWPALDSRCRLRCRPVLVITRRTQDHAVGGFTWGVTVGLVG